jgi:hypothetical protein
MASAYQAVDYRSIFYISYPTRKGKARSQDTFGSPN